MNQQLMSILETLIEFKRTNKKQFFKPYDFQLEFCNAGKHFKQRAFCAGNRVGKTEVGAYEMSCHLTGDYPEWWDGYRVTDSGHEFIAVGITLPSTQKILQHKLFGTNDVRDELNIGTGFIPKDSIVFDPMEKDGGRIVSCSIRHVDGGTNKLYFFSAADEKKIMGMTLKGVWIDESDKTQCGKLYSQCVTRTLTTNGFVMQTFTPENGVDDVVKKFMDANAEDSDRLYLKMASMYDAHVNNGGHITDDMIDEVKAAAPEFEWECRIHGIPSAGSGAVFPLRDSEIISYDIEPQPHWNITCAFDIGKVVDPTVISFVATDDEGITHLIEQIYLQGSIYDKDAKAIAEAIKASKYPHVLTVSPHDGGLNSASPESVAKKMIEYGINVYSLPFRNPQDTQLSSKPVTQQSGQSVRRIETGLQEMRTRFKEGTFKISRECTHWFKEKQTYFYLEKGEPVDKNNHCIDSSRYAFMSHIGNVHCTVQEATTGTSGSWKLLQPRLRA